MATTKKGNTPAKKVPAKKVAAKTARATGAKLVQDNAVVALVFNLNKLDKAQRRKLETFAEGMGLTVSKIRDGGPGTPPPPPPGPVTPARKKPAKKPTKKPAQP